MLKSRMLLAAALAAVSAGTARAAQYPRVSLLDTAVLRAPRLDESSGIVESRRRPGVFWTINDSGNPPLLLATDSSGSDLGFVTVRGAANVDWEDISIGPCTRSAGTCLYVADTGDNNSARPAVVVYVVPEPEPPREPADTMRAAAPEDTLVLRYPDHPHDAEAIAITARWLLLVTKDRTAPAVLYRTPLRGSGARTLERVAPLALRISMFRGRLVTGAAIRDDTVLVLRTYATLHLFALRGGQPVPVTDLDGIGIPVIETQGEGVAFDHAGRLVLSSERGGRGHAILTRLRLFRPDSR